MPHLTLVARCKDCHYQAEPDLVEMARPTVPAVTVLKGEHAAALLALKTFALGISGCGVQDEKLTG
jgi:hypothetical protein